MSLTSTRPAEELAAERLELAANVQKMRDELVSASDEVRSEKAAEFESAVAKLESLDRETQLAFALENAEAMVKKLSQQPARQSPVLVQKSGFVTHNPATGQSVSYGVSFDDPAEARASYEYHKAFQAFVKVRGKIDRVVSLNHRDMLERYGKGDNGMADGEFYMPFRKDMTIAATTNGSNAIAPDFRFDVITPRTYVPVMSRICRVISTNVTKVTFPRNSDTNNDTRYGTSFRPHAGETPNTTLSNKDTGPFTQLVIDVNTGTMFTDVSADFLQDALGTSAYLQSEASKAFAATVDDEVINATNSMAGSILACTSIGVTKTGANNTLSAPKMVDAYHAFRSQYATNLAWVMARGTHGKLINLLDANNRSLFLPSYEGGLVPGASAQILGTPVYFNEFMPTSGTSTPKSIIVGDFNEYLLLLRQGFTVMFDDISLQYANRIRVTCKYRFGGAVRDPRAFNIVHELA
jgi:HK97 family phage major capsid protein